MSEQDSFIAEVNDAVRQDQLYGYVRRYGWIAALAIIALVGGAAWNEYRKAQQLEQAQALGDSILDALDQDEATVRAAELASLTAEGPAAAIASLMTSAALVEANDNEAARVALDTMSTAPEIPQIYRDIALFKSALLSSGETRVQKLQALAQPGNGLRLLAQEQLALAAIESGDTQSAVAQLRAILEDAETNPSLAERAQTLIVALGAPLDEASSEAEQ